MKKIKIEFTKCIQDSQDYGSDNEHMISTVFFNIEGKEYFCCIRQPYGANFSFEKDPIEVETPIELKGKLNYGEFRECVESYFRQIIGKSNSIISIAGSSNVRMKNNTFYLENVYEINDVNPESGGW